MATPTRRDAIKSLITVLAMILIGCIGTTVWTPTVSANPVEVRGEIARIGDGVFVLETRRGRVVVAVSERTVIVRNGERVRFGALQVGDRAGVRGRYDRRNDRIRASHVRAIGR